MALIQELDPNDKKGSLSKESTGVEPYKELIRDYEPDPDVVWRFGKPNYSTVNKAYFQHRSMQHPEGSLEAVVSKLVKNWEVESHHIADVHQWKTMDITKFKAALNGGCPCSAQLMADIGPYNMLIGEHQHYSSKAHSFLDSNTQFGHTFTEGFAWEVLQVLSGPPTVTFKWRHFGKYTGEFTDKVGHKHKGNGDMVNIIGLCIAKVNDALKIESLDIYYSPDDLLGPLVTKTERPGGNGEIRPIGADEADAKTRGGGGCCQASKGGGCALM
mmetsp:Transcript_111249/g.314903  ORF Transcript_111249/g.314903 Transcript_111249/m.314903 type:complete len:272 (+) Transcript_111249:57-872(+)